jgi:hypothetical protein
VSSQEVINEQKIRSTEQQNETRSIDQFHQTHNQKNPTTPTITLLLLLPNLKNPVKTRLDRNRNKKTPYIDALHKSVRRHWETKTSAVHDRSQQRTKAIKTHRVQQTEFKKISHQRTQTSVEKETQNIQKTTQ